jgi:hypothetical protein
MIAALLRRVRAAHRRYVAQHQYQMDVYRRAVIQRELAYLKDAEHRALLAEAESRCRLKSL